jgi:hypothetical protein
MKKKNLIVIKTTGIVPRVMNFSLIATEKFMFNLLAKPSF